MSVKKVLAGFLLTIVALLSYFVCQGMFSGYPQYGTGILSGIGLIAIMATGGAAWIIDHRHLDDD